MPPGPSGPRLDTDHGTVPAPRAATSPPSPAPVTAPPSPSTESVHGDGDTARMPSKSSPAVTTQRVDPEAWSLARLYADGDTRRLEVVDERTVLVRNTPN